MRVIDRTSRTFTTRSSSVESTGAGRKSRTALGTQAGPGARSHSLTHSLRHSRTLSPMHARTHSLTHTLTPHSRTQVRPVEHRQGLGLVVPHPAPRGDLEPRAPNPRLLARRRAGILDLGLILKKSTYVSFLMPPLLLVPMVIHLIMLISACNPMPSPIDIFRLACVVPSSGSSSPRSCPREPPCRLAWQRPVAVRAREAGGRAREGGGFGFRLWAFGCCDRLNVGRRSLLLLL